MAKVVTITNPVTGQPAQVDQLDHTAQQIDDAVAAARWSHRNLLDNAYFANPDAIIDQRGGYVVPPGRSYYSLDWSAMVGTTDAYYPVIRRTGGNNDAVISISGTEYVVSVGDAVRGYVGAGYGIDRWKNTGGIVSLLVNDGYLTVTGSSAGAAVDQYFEDDFPVGTTMTLSALMRCNSAKAGIQVRFGASYSNVAAVKGTGDWELVVLTFITNGNENKHVRFRCYDSASTFDIKAAKLELGSIQTLAHQDENGNWVLNDPPPDQALELAKCQRYYTRVEIKQAYNNTTGLAVPIIVAGGGNWANILIELPSMMRVDAKPVVKVSGLSVADFSGNQIADIASDAVVNVAAFTGSMVVVSIQTTTSLSVGYSVLLKQGGYIEIINDL